MTMRGVDVASLPREISPGIFWLSTCLVVRDGPWFVHNHNSCFLIVGRDSTVLIDNAMPSGWPDIRDQLAGILRGRPLDYLFPTHPEAPHMGNCGPLMDQYPRARLVGDLRNYHLYYPGAEHRFITMTAGEALDLGGRRLVFVPAVIRDLPNTLWGYDPDARVLFVSDAYPYTHEHEAGQCGMTAEEMPKAVRPEDTDVVIERALSWTRYVDAEIVIEELEAFLASHPADIVAPAHGGVITDPKALTAVFEAGLRRVRRPRD
jgi:flavorubredoxin